jgi:sterol desaturase/sphingolipid hydroxylase (fatty acid hydroxylase superfamily)
MFRFPKLNSTLEHLEICGNLLAFFFKKNYFKTMKYNSVRMFKSDFLEKFTHIHPISPLVVWVPIVSYFFYQGRDLSTVELFLTFITGMFVWTFSEYILHRFVFHFEPKSSWGKRLIFILHGVHHDDPQDPTRLVFSPPLGIILFLILYYIFSFFVPDRYFSTFLGSFLIGYLCYDYIHYATHHFPMTSKIGKFLRAYHLQHHYSHKPKKYGVSNPLWDYVFRTVD